MMTLYIFATTHNEQEVVTLNSVICESPKMLSRLFPSLFPSKSDSEISISGSVAPGFEAVREEFENNFRNGLETNAQCCAYVGTEKVFYILF